MRSYKQPYLSGRVYNNDSVLNAGSNKASEDPKKKLPFNIKETCKPFKPSKPYVAPLRDYGPMKQLGVSFTELFSGADDFPEFDSEITTKCATPLPPLNLKATPTST